MKVLFVQEKPFLATALKCTLLSKGFDLFISNQTLHPLPVMDEINPAIVIADMSHCTAIHYVEEAKKKNIPVIVITAYDRQEELQYAFDKGADDYICLPLSYAELALRISILAKQKVHAVA